MYKPLLYINNYEVKNIIAYDDLASVQDGENSGRVPTLTMHRDILGRIMSINVTVGVSPVSEVRTLLGILKNPEITVRFLDTETDSYKTINCYCVDPQKERLEGMMDYFRSLSFVLNSIERYD